MPINPTYPGIYIEEVPSQVRTIVGVPTSISAFVGRARRGPVDEPTIVNSYGDYERIFGGMALFSNMSYAVKDFFLNGGGRAVIVRLFHQESVAGAPPGTASLEFDNVKLEAANPGAWGNKLKATITHSDKAAKEAAKEQGLELADLFNITLEDTVTGSREDYLNVSVKKGPRRLDRVLASQSVLMLVSNQTALPNARPKEGSYKVEQADKASDGAYLVEDDYKGKGKEDAKEGLYALKKAEIFNLLLLPPDLKGDDIPKTLLTTAASFCEEERAMLLVDPPTAWTDKAKAVTGINNGEVVSNSNAAIFFPRIKQPNPLRDNQVEEFVPSGAVAGVIARTDADRGVWKAPAGIEATLNGVPELSVKLTDKENGDLNQKGVNCLRTFPVIGRVVWGARTLKGADVLASQWKYISVRRLALFIEETLYRNTQWIIFEPNDEPIWAQIRLNIGTFMHDLFRQGAFQGTTPRQAYLVKCDSETTTQSDIDKGIVNITVGFAPPKPAEFVIIKIQQLAGQVQ